MESIITLGAYPGNEIRCVFARVLPRAPVDLLSADVSLCDDVSLPVRPDPPSLTDGSNSSPPLCEKPGYGGTPRRVMFGLRARRRIIRAGACLDEFVPAGEVLFLTGTLPGGTGEAMRAIACWSSWLVHSLKKWIWKRERSSDSLYCWEYQKRGALHLHYAVRLSSAVARRFVKDGFRRWWYAAMRNISDRAGCDVFARATGGTWKDAPEKIQADAQVVEKSVGRYLAKYLSKAATGFSSVMHPSPVRWFGVSRSLSARVAAATCEVVLRFSDEMRFRLAREQVYSVLASAEGVRWGYRDKCGFAEVSGIYPATHPEYECLKKEFESMNTVGHGAVVSPRANAAELARYWAELRIAFPSLPQFCEKSSPSRYAYLCRVTREEGLPSLDMIVLTRWIMSCLAAYTHPRSYKRVAVADGRISEYLLRAIGIAGDPAKNWAMVAPDLRVPVVARVHPRATIRYKQYGG